MKQGVYERYNEQLSVLHAVWLSTSRRIRWTEHTAQIQGVSKRTLQIESLYKFIH
jgi:hypothetical protein